MVACANDFAQAPGHRSFEARISLSVLLYLIYGDDPRYHLELTFSIASALRFLKDDPADIRVILMTDQANARPDLGIEQVIISDADLRSWQLDGRFNHAVKQGALRQALHLFNDKVILMDTDTLLRAHPKLLFQRVSKGRTLMNTDEGPLSGAKSVRRYDAMFQAAVGQLEGYRLSLDRRMYNSGVCGIDPADGAMMDRAMALTLALWQLDPIFTAEQLATSVVFQTDTQVSCCDAEVDHYWPRARTYFHSQFAAAYPKRDLAAFQRLVTVPPVIEEVPSAGVKLRVLARLKTLQRRNDKVYGYAYLSYLHAIARADKPALANACADQALNTLMYGCRPRHPFASRDFARFGPARIAAERWLEPRIAARWSAYWATFSAG